MNKLTETGLRIIDSNFAIELRLGTQWYGWLFQQHPDGQYVSIKKLNDGEILNIKSMLTYNVKSCTWENYNDENTYSTSCGNEFILNEGTPQENCMKFCCYCGKPIDQLVEL